MIMTMHQAEVKAAEKSNFDFQILCNTDQVLLYDHSEYSKNNALSSALY